MDEVLEQQAERRIEAKMRREVDERISATQSQSRIQSDLNLYLERYPDLQQKRGATWERVQREYQYLRQIGAPDGAATELAALRAALGPPERIGEKTRQVRERSEETLGANGGDEVDESARGRGWTKGLDARQIKYYQGLIDVGHFTGPDDPKLVRELRVARGEDPRKVMAKRHGRPQPGESRVQ